MKHKKRREDLVNNPHFDKLYQKRLAAQRAQKNDLFDNPMVRNARSQMTEEQLDSYKKKGEAMYNGIDFIGDGSSKETVPQVMADSIKQVLDSIKAGEHISFLEKNEKNLMSEYYGEEWYSKYGYEKEDLEDIVNIPNFDILSKVFQNKDNDSKTND